MQTVTRYYPGTLAAGGSITLNATGNYVFLLSNTGAAASLKINIDDQQFQPMPVGIVLKTDNVFNKIVLLNTDTAASSFVLIIGQGDIDYKALVIGNVISFKGEQASAVVNAGSQVTLSAEGQIYAASSTRKGAIISNPITNGKLYIHFGATTASATVAFAEINPGVIYEIPAAFLAFELRGFMASSGQSLFLAEC